MKWKEKRCSRYLEKKHRNFAPFLVGLSFVFFIFYFELPVDLQQANVTQKQRQNLFFFRSSFYLYSYNTPDDKSA